MSCAGHSPAWLPLSSQPQPFGFPRPWQLILCSSCAAQGTHRRCSTLADTADSWECDSCAGLGTGKMQTVPSVPGLGSGKGWHWVLGSALPESLKRRCARCE